jgi:hypothetical protein
MVLFGMMNLDLFAIHREREIVPINVLFEWVDFQPHLAQHIKTYFDGSEVNKYALSSPISLWRMFSC